MRSLVRPLVTSLFLLVLAGCVSSAPRVDPAAEERTIGALLDDWHDAAAQGDEPRYFGHFAEGGVFLGTDDTERWDVAAFRAYAHPHFARGKAWAFHATRRAIHVEPRAGVAWFDETLATEKLGPARGSGVLAKDAGGTWRIAQYNLALTIPNERFEAVRHALTAAPSAGKPSDGH